MGRFVQYKAPCLKGSGLWKLDTELEERFNHVTLVATEEQDILLPPENPNTGRTTRNR